MSTYLLTNVNSSLSIVGQMDNFRAYILKKQSDLQLTNEELSKRAGRTGAWFTKFMSGERKDIKVETLLSLSKALQVPPIKLLMAYQGKDPEVYEDPSDEQVKIALNEAIKSIETIKKQYNND